MARVAIRAEKLSKLYHIGPQARFQRSLRETLTDALNGACRVLSARNRAPSLEADGAECLWALKDVSFEVKTGEVVGIIGRNGAGKSTLLKVLSRITEPTDGWVEMLGRVGSLLEVGTGFHADLTGRENIFLNGAILGMKRAEIRRKFDEIVAFAEVEPFIDTPVKRYSSGMYVRLAFAVAAHLEPEILIVDEVLSVGDLAFQKKCLGRIGEIGREGRTILFVTHNLVSVNALCQRAILLEKGRLVRDDKAPAVVAEYIALNRTAAGEAVWSSPAEAPGTDKLRLRAVRIVSDGRVGNDVNITSEVTVEMDYWVLRPGLNVAPSIHLLDKLGTTVLCTGTDSIIPPPGLFRARCTIPANFLNDGLYSISALLVLDSARIEVQAEQVISFTVHETPDARSEYLGTVLGTVRPRLPWHIAAVGPESSEAGATAAVGAE
jgi:lipopolysaccharide transport system ATP-binding protein